MQPEVLLSELIGDPLLTWTLIAAFLLGMASLASGLVRLDFLAIGSGPAALAIVLCLLVAVSLRLLLGPPVTPDGAAWAATGFERFPLALAALAYGPTVGLLSAAIFTALIAAFGESVGAGEVLLAFELLLLGWLAIFPSPRIHRWAAPMNALVAISLTWLTAGVATARITYGEFEPFLTFTLNPVSFTSVTTTLALLLILPGNVYRFVFRDSRIAPPTDDIEAQEPDDPDSIGPGVERAR